MSGKRRGKRRERRASGTRGAAYRSSGAAEAYLHGLAAIGDERWEEAVAALQRFLRASVRPEERAGAYASLSACYLALEEYEDALAMLDQAEHHGGDASKIVHARGVIHGCAGHAEEALAALRAFRRRWPDRARQMEIADSIRQLRRIERGEAPPGDYLDGASSRLSQRWRHPHL
jgi:tetratricopeptide (TPR) repeat protein